MFGWFSKKDKINEAMTSSHIASSKAAALNALIDLLKSNPKANVFYYFAASKDEFVSLLQQKGIAFKDANGYLSDGSAIYLHDARKFNVSLSYEERRFYCIDVFPLLSELKKLKQQLAIINSDAVLHVYAGLNEPFFKSFGGDKILDLMQKLGMREDELLENKSIDNSIENAQQKLEEKVQFETHAKSSQEWFDKNIINK